MTGSQIIIQELGFSFDKDNKVLNNISLSIDKGEFLSVLGASGSGKSTLLRLVSNILPAKSSHNLERNISIFDSTPHEYLNSGKLSFMFQEASLMPNLNVVDNIKFPLKLRGDAINNDFIDNLIKVIGLENHKNKYPSELSGGMKTRVSLARAFVTKPELLLLDEPFSALDVSWKFELYRYLKEFSAKYNTTVILVTHDIQESIVLGDKIVVMSKMGSVLREIKPHKENIKHYDVKSVNNLLKNNIDYFIDLQNEIRIDSIRENATIDEANEILDYLLDKTQSNETIQKHIIEQIQSLKSHITDEDIYSKLLKLWNETNQWDVKQNIMWRLLDNPKAPETIHNSIYNFIMSDWERYVKESQTEEYFHKSKIFDRTINRLQSQDYPSSKDWLYLLYLKAMSQGEVKMEKDAEIFIHSYCETHSIIGPVSDFKNEIAQ